MALPILAKGITSALTKKGKDAKKDDKVSAQKLLPNSITSPTKSKHNSLRLNPENLHPIEKKLRRLSFFPPQKLMKSLVSINLGIFSRL